MRSARGEGDAPDGCGARFRGSGDEAGAGFRGTGRRLPGPQGVDAPTPVGAGMFCALSSHG